VVGGVAVGVGGGGGVSSAWAQGAHIAAPNAAAKIPDCRFADRRSARASAHSKAEEGRVATFTELSSRACVFDDELGPCVVIGGLR
jgi:hypothetical protein